MRKAGCIMRTINQQDLPSGVGMSCDAGGISRSSGDPAREVLNSQPALESRTGGGLNTSHRLLRQFRSRILIRAAVDSPFGNIIAREVGAQWCGGYLLGTRRLRRKLTVTVPAGFKLRRFRKGDEKDMSRIHHAAFHIPHPPREYLEWATNPNCRTTLAVSQGEAVGFLTAEKRHDGSYGDFHITVEPQFHRKELGAAPMERGLNHLIEIGCETAVGDYWLQNAKVQALNRKYGFTSVRAYNYYETQAAS